MKSNEAQHGQNIFGIGIAAPTAQPKRTYTVGRKPSKKDIHNSIVCNDHFTPEGLEKITIIGKMDAYEAGYYGESTGFVVLFVGNKSGHLYRIAGLRLKRILEGIPTL